MSCHSRCSGSGGFNRYNVANLVELLTALQENGGFSRVGDVNDVIDRENLLRCRPRSFWFTGHVREGV